MAIETTIKEFIESSVKSLMESDDATTYHMELDGNLALYVGWANGFDETGSSLYHSKSQPSYCICVKIAENAYPYLWDDVYMPWETDCGAVYDTECSIGNDDDIMRLSNWLVAAYADIRVLLDTGVLTI